MSNKLIEQIKAIKGVKTIIHIPELCENSYLVTFENEEPIYIDPETGDEFFDGDKVWFFSKYSFKIEDSIVRIQSIFTETQLASKYYKRSKDCEIALAKYIFAKNNLEIKYIYK